MAISVTWSPAPSTMLLLPILCLKLRIKDQQVCPFNHPNSSHHAPATAAQMTLIGVSTFTVLNFLITVKQAALQGKHTLFKCPPV